MSIRRWFGRVFRLSSERRESPPDVNVPTTPEADARRIAASWAAENNKRWSLPADAGLSDQGGRRLWLIQSNALGKGYSLAITIDDATGEVVAHHEYPR